MADNERFPLSQSLRCPKYDRLPTRFVATGPYEMCIRDRQSDDRQNQDELLIASVLKMETVEENILHRPEYRFFIVRESIVAGFLDTLPDRFGFGRQVGVPARHQEQFP